MSDLMDNAMNLAKYIYDNYANLSQPSERDISNLAMLILEHDIEIVAGCADRAVNWSHEMHPEGMENKSIEEISKYLDDGLRTAILGDIA